MAVRIGCFVRLPLPLTALVSLCLAGVCVLPQPAAASSTQLPPALTSLQSCLESSHHLLVLDLIDESGSLVTTDPTNQRVVGIKAELAGLARLADTPIAGHRVDVEVRLASFATGYAAVGPESASHPVWRQVNNGSLPSLLSIANVVRTRNQGLDTDYVTALRGAQHDILERSAELTRNGGAPPCKAIVWFTDGRYDLEPRTTSSPGRGLTVPYAPSIPITSPAAAQRGLAIGRHLMCDNGGLVDQLRENQIKILAVVLDQELTTQAREFMQSATENVPPSACGRHGAPDSGLYLPAAQGTQLLFLFSSLFDTPAALRFCPAPGQASCKFTTIPGLSSFSLEISTPASADKVVLRGPSGSVAQLSPSGPYATTVSGAKVTAEWFSPQAVEVDGQLPDSTKDWVGRWSFAFANPTNGPGGSGTYTLRLRADLFPSLFGSALATVGKAATVTLGFTDSLGQRVQNSPLLNGATLQAKLVDLDTNSQLPLTVSPAGTGQWTTTFTPIARGGGVPHLALALNSLLVPSAGVTVTTEPRQTPLTISPPPSYPRVAQSELLLPSVRGLGSTRGTVTINGPDRGSGCVWLSASAVGLPQRADIGKLSVTPAPSSPSACMHVQSGQKRTITVVAKPRVSGTGRATGALTFHLIDSAGGQLRSAVQVSFDMQPAPNVGRAIVIFVLLLAFGIAIPLGLLFLLNWFGARFARPQLLRYVARDVELSDEGLTALGGDPLDVSAAEFKLVANERRVEAKRTFELDDGRFRFTGRAVRRRGERRQGERIPSLLLGPYGVVETHSGLAVAGARGARLDHFRSAGTHEVPLSLAGTWIFDPDRAQVTGPDPLSELQLEGDPPPQPLRGRLLMFVPSDVPQDGSEVLLEAERHLQEQEGELKEQLCSRPSGGSRPPRLLERLKRRQSHKEEPPAPPSEPSDEELFKTRT